jgi:outer membrane protein assembly factor BamB
LKNNSHWNILLPLIIITTFFFISISPLAVGYIGEKIDQDFNEYINSYCFTHKDYSKSQFTKQNLLLDSGISNITSKKLYEQIKPIFKIYSGPINSSWPIKCYDNRHTSQSPYSTVEVTDIEKWRFYCDEVEESAVIDNNGTIYFGSWDGYLYALYPNGSLKWKYYTDGMIWSTPAIAEDGTIFVGNIKSRLTALYSNGTKKWIINVGGPTISPTIANDGTIYIGAEDDLIAVNPNGSIKWKYNLGSYIFSVPAIGDDETIFFGCENKYCYALYPNGTLKWRFKTGDKIKAPPSVAEDGTIYIGSFDGWFYALYPNNGTLKWKYKIGSGTEANAAINTDGTIFVAGDELYSIYPNGTMNWHFNFGTNRWVSKSSPAISGDGTIYVGTHIGYDAGGEIVAINPDGTERWRKKLTKWAIDSSPCIGEDGTVYIGSTHAGKGYLHAFGPVESNRPPEAPTIKGKRNGTVGEKYIYTFTTDDPDRNPIEYFIEWGDGNSTGWTREWASGENAYYRHKWSEEGDYTIRAKAKDVLGEESDWGILKVTIPKNQNVFQGRSFRFPILHGYLYGLKANIGFSYLGIV